MTTKFKIIHKIFWKNGNYLATITDERIDMLFEDAAVAIATFKQMKSDGLDVELNDKGIVQKMPGYNEEEIVKMVRHDLYAASERKGFIRKFSYEEMTSSHTLKGRVS